MEGEEEGFIKEAETAEETIEEKTKQYNFKYGHIAVSKETFNHFRELKDTKTDDAFQKKLLECWKRSQEQLK